jgi:hypothetical protein
MMPAVRMARRPRSDRMQSEASDVSVAAALALVGRPQDEHDIFEGHHDDQRPQDQGRTA